VTLFLSEPDEYDGGELVVDARKPLGLKGITAIGRSLEVVVRNMEVQDVPAGEALARRVLR